MEPGIPPAPPPVRPDERWSAAVLLCDRAASPAEARLFLDICGLLDVAGPPRDLFAPSRWMTAPARREV